MLQGWCFFIGQSRLASLYFPSQTAHGHLYIIFVKISYVTAKSLDTHTLCPPIKSTGFVNTITGSTRLMSGYKTTPGSHDFSLLFDLALIFSIVIVCEYKYCGCKGGLMNPVFILCSLGLGLGLCYSLYCTLIKQNMKTSGACVNHRLHFSHWTKKTHSIKSDIRTREPGVLKMLSNFQASGLISAALCDEGEKLPAQQMNQWLDWVNEILIFKVRIMKHSTFG